MRVGSGVGVLLLVSAIGVGAGCRQTSTTNVTAGEGKAAPPALPPPADMPVSEPASPTKTFTGRIVETMEGGDYSYLHLKDGTDEAWIAAPRFDARTGDQISVSLDMPMRNFRSPTLNRTFPLVYFVQEIGRPGQPGASAGAPPSLMNSHGGSTAAPTVQRLEPPPGGVSVADVFAQKDRLSGKPVTVRGTVVKFNGGILDRNWLHVQDGSGSAGTHDNDLAVTTDAVVAVGDVVTISGVLGTARDFGAGYAYDAIIEGATVTGR